MKKVLFVLAMIVGMWGQAQWSELGGVNGLAANGGINAICKDKYGNIYAAGWFVNANGKNYVAVYNGSSWSELGGVNALANIVPANQLIGSLCSDTFGNIYVANNYVNGSGISYVAKYNGTSWSILGGTYALFSSGEIKALFCDKAGNVYVGGGFINPSGNNFVAKFDGNSWSELGGSNSLAANGRINTICGDKTGNIYAAGWFTNSVNKYYVAKYDGSNWSQFGGVSSFTSAYQIFSICTDTNSNVYAGIVGSLGHWSVVKCNGIYLNQLGNAYNNYWNGGYYILSVCVDNFGNTYAGNGTNLSGNQFIAKYNGNNCSELGGNNSLAANDEIMITYCDTGTNNVYAGGAFTNASGKHYVAKYTQTLPLKLFSFIAQMQPTPNPSKEGNVLLNWQTANEVNVSHINIQRSTNNNEFITIGKVNVGVSRYSFFDDKLPNTNDKLTLYYRLETVDKDGSKTYSEVKQVVISKEQLAISIYPNPSKEFFNVVGKSIKEIQIINQLGQVVYREIATGTNLHNDVTIINIKNLNKGLYIVQVITTKGEVKNEKFIIE